MTHHEGGDLWGPRHPHGASLTDALIVTKYETRIMLPVRRPEVFGHGPRNVTIQLRCALFI